MKNTLLVTLFIACGIALLCAPVLVFSDAMPDDNPDPLAPNPTPIATPKPAPKPDSIDTVVKKGDYLLYEYGKPEEKLSLRMTVVDVAKDTYTVQYEFRKGDSVLSANKEQIPIPTDKPEWQKDTGKLQKVNYNTKTGNDREQQLICYILPGKDPQTKFWMCEFVPLGGVVKIEQGDTVILALKEFKRAGD